MPANICIYALRSAICLVTYSGEAARSLGGYKLPLAARATRGICAKPQRKFGNGGTGVPP